MRKESPHRVGLPASAALLAASVALTAGCGVIPKRPDQAPSPTPPASSPAPTLSGPASTSDPSLWRRVWADEFDGSALDTGRWTAERESTYGDGNSELACLTDRPENLAVDGGQLTITALREPEPYACGTRDARFPQGREYTSALVHTRETASWTYGKFEVRAKVPTEPGRSQGLWPAFWMRPVDGGIGEIDVLETTGTGDAARPSVLHQTILYDYKGTQPAEKTEYVVPPGAPAPWQDFHTYSVEWDLGEIRWYVDGAQTFVRNRATTSWLDEAFARPFFLRLNMAVGGTFAGAPAPETAFPGRFVVDFVRVYARKVPPQP